MKRSDRGASVKPADQIEQELASGLAKAKLAEFVEDEEVEAGEIVGQPRRSARASASSRLTKSTVVKKRPRRPARMPLRAIAITRGLSASGAANQHDVALLADDPAGGEPRTNASLMCEGVFLWFECYCYVVLLALQCLCGSG
jgi:hypothetical protein